MRQFHGSAHLNNERGCFNLLIGPESRLYEWKVRHLRKETSGAFGVLEFSAVGGVVNDCNKEAMLLDGEDDLFKS